MADGDQPPPAKRSKLLPDEVGRMTKEEIIQRCLDQEAQVEALMGAEGSENPLADLQEKYRLLQQETARRENVLVMRLTAKDQELQELLAQNEEMKRAQNPSTAQLRGMLLDPAINLMFQRMKKEMEQSKEKLEQAQNDLAAWKFTPDGQTGKRLMAKCRLLLQENSELGKVIAAGRTAKLEGEIALGKKFVEEMKQSQAETDEFLVEMDEDVEGLQSTIYLLQQQLKESKEQVQALQQQQQQEEEEERTSCNEDSTVEPQEHRTTEGAAAGSKTQTTSNGSNNHHIGTTEEEEDMMAEQHMQEEEEHRQSPAPPSVERMDTEQCTGSSDPPAWTPGSKVKQQLVVTQTDSAIELLQNGTLDGGSNGSGSSNGVTTEAVEAAVEVAAEVKAVAAEVTADQDSM